MAIGIRSFQGADSADPGLRKVRRPTGELLLNFAAQSVLAASLALVVGVIPHGADEGIRWFLYVLAAGLLQLAHFLGVAGIVVRAIWFLPGESERAL